VYRIGYLAGGSSTSSRYTIEAFRQGLRELGWVEGQNIVIDYRFAEGRLDPLPDLAAELVRLKVDVVGGAVGTSGGSQERHGNDSHRHDWRWSRSCWARAHREPRAPGRQRHRVVL